MFRRREKRPDKVSGGTIAAIVWACLALSTASSPAGRSIDSAHSSLHVHVYKSGLFSAFGHNHDVEAPIESGEVTEGGKPFVEFRVDARKLRVLDAEASLDTRAEIQKTMQGPQVLESDRYPEIHFLSTTIQATGTDHWVVTGNLDLHGQTHPVTVGVTLKDGLYRGSAILKQTQFGITPVTVAGGTVKVRDDLRIDFQIVLSK
jgi:polyisoprenoid-binding protein YceI